jgi:hypothetical protein
VTWKLNHHWRENPEWRSALCNCFYKSTVHTINLEVSFRVCCSRAYVARPYQLFYRIGSNFVPNFKNVKNCKLKKISCVFKILRHINTAWGTWYRSWLRHYAISRKVAGSSPDEVDLFNWPNPCVDSASNRNEYQGSPRGVKGGRRVRLTTLPPSVSRLVRENVGASKSHNPIGLHGLLQG